MLWCGHALEALVSSLAGISLSNGNAYPALENLLVSNLELDCHFALFRSFP